MAVPIELPIPFPANSKKFDLLPNQLMTPIGNTSNGGGFIQTLQRSQPYWVAEWGTPPLRDDREQLMRAFLDSLEGSLNPFLGYDPRRPMPYAYKHLPIGTAPWGSVVAQTASFTNSELLLRSTSPLKMTRGDYVQVNIGNQVRLFRVRNSPAQGTLLGLLVSPRPPTFLSEDHPARLIRAGAAFKMIGAPDWNDQVDSLPSVRFQAVQFIDRNT